MTLLEEIRNMQAEGKSDQEIISGLRARKIPEPQIIDALSQTKIKEAISAQPEEENENPIKTQEVYAPSPQQAQQEQNQQYQGYDQMQEQPYEQAQQEPAYAPSPQQAQQEQNQQYQGYDQMQEQPYEQAQQEPAYAPSPQQGYSQQSYPLQQPGHASSDTINEIAEQVVEEKITSINKKLDSALNMKTTFEANIESLDERLKRVEKIIDRLQLSVLQKVGSYLTNVEDIKKELEETRKSFKSALTKSNNSSPVKKTIPKKISS